MYLLSIFLIALKSSLTNEQLSFVLLLAIAIVQAINIIWVGLLKKPKPSIGSIRWILFGVALVLAYKWSPFDLPTTDDPMGLAVALITIALEILVLAQIVYDKLVEAVLGGLDKYLLTPIYAAITKNRDVTVNFLRPKRFPF